MDHKSCIVKIGAKCIDILKYGILTFLDLSGWNTNFHIKIFECPILGSHIFSIKF